MIYGYYKGNPNYCAPYITKEMFDKLQAIIKRNPRTTSNDHAYIFTGLIKCPDCGNRLTGSMNNNKKNGKTYKYYNYRCFNNRTNKLCPFNKAVFENTLEKMLLDRLEGIIADKKVKSIEIRANSNKVSKYNMAELQSELDRLNYSWQKGRIKSVDEYDRRYDEIMHKIETANEEAQSIANEPDYEKFESVLEGGWKEIYNALDDEHKRAFWRSFIDEIQIDWTSKKKVIKDIIFF